MANEGAHKETRLTPDRRAVRESNPGVFATEILKVIDREDAVKSPITAPVEKTAAAREVDNDRHPVAPEVKRGPLFGKEDITTALVTGIAAWIAPILVGVAGWYSGVKSAEKNVKFLPFVGKAVLVGAAITAAFAAGTLFTLMPATWALLATAHPLALINPLAAVISGGFFGTAYAAISLIGYGAQNAAKVLEPILMRANKR